MRPYQSWTGSLHLDPQVGGREKDRQCEWHESFNPVTYLLQQVTPPNRSQIVSPTEDQALEDMSL